MTSGTMHDSGREARHAFPPLYLLVPFLGAALLFQVELLISKYILPWFGGTPNVWAVSMLFFQVALVAGYAWAHHAATRLTARRQAWLHVALLLAALSALLLQALAWGRPLLAGPALQPHAGDPPTARILLVLAVTVGLPFFALSTTTSLLQAWFGREFPGRSPYPLFAVSNAGSLFGLLSYPLLIEPLFGLRAQAACWAGGFALFAVGCGALALRSRQPGTWVAATDPADVAGNSRPVWWERLLWLALPAAASVLLLATTNQLANDVPVIPFLWAVPLAIYLLTFILAFARRPLYRRPLFVALALALMILVGQAAMTPIVHGREIVLRMAVYDLALFVGCLLCHGELARLRPAPVRLTDYYLCVSLGGAAGGLFVGLLAPRLFADLWELYVGYFLCGVCVLAAMAGDARSRLNRSGWRGPLRLAGGTVLLLLAAGPPVLLGERAPQACRCWAEPVARFLDVARPSLTRTLLARRNFYGVLRVRETELGPRIRILWHGPTMHGFQFTGSDVRRREPTAYYTTASGIGRAIRNHPAYGTRGMRVGAIGLGVGTLAAYGQPGDCYRFYEIDPDVIDLAASPQAVFSFLRDSRATVEVVAGDARLSLEREPPQQFDVLAVDAFSGDSVPVHLLTREALALYLRHVRPDGMVAFHVTSRHLDLALLVQKLADSMGLASCRFDQVAQSAWIVRSRWILIFRDPGSARRPAFASATDCVRVDPAALDRVQVWTDDYSDLYPLLMCADAEHSGTVR